MSPRHLLIAAAAAGTAILSQAPAAMGAQRYASPSSTDVSGSCSVLAPCRLDHAVGDAGAGDEVIVEPGTYAVTYPVQASVPIDLHGVVGQPRPRLAGDPHLAADVLLFTNGGSIGYLEVESTQSNTAALDADAVTGSALVLENAVGNAAMLRGASLLRDSVVQVGSTDPAVQTENGKAAGAAKLLNDTVVAPDAQAPAVYLRNTSAATVIRNSIVRGGAGDVSAFARASAAIDHSNFRPTSSSAYTDGGGNSSADPLLGPDLRLQPGSPAIDGGTPTDADIGPSDADGGQRVFGAAPDMGAFEFGAPSSNWNGSTTGGTTTGGGDGPGQGNRISPPTPPAAGKRVNVGPVSGSVKVRTPGAARFVTLADDASVPVGSIIDATSGVATVTSARSARDSRPQTGRFWGGRFQVKQSARGDGYTDLVLKGGSFRGCKRAAHAKAVAAGHRRAIRRLWGRDRHGRFRSTGRHGQATVRGTVWLTQDRCDGTLFSVRRGAIAVKAKGARRAVRVRAGRHYLARAR